MAERMLNSSTNELLGTVCPEVALCTRGIMLGSSHSLPNAFPLFWSGGLMPHADYIFVSKEAAQGAGFTDRQTAVEGLVSDCRQG